jgi:hypothetical protein
VDCMSVSTLPCIYVCGHKTGSYKKVDTIYHPTKRTKPCFDIKPEEQYLAGAFEMSSITAHELVGGDVLHGLRHGGGSSA